MPLTIGNTPDDKKSGDQLLREELARKLLNWAKGLYYNDTSMKKVNDMWVAYYMAWSPFRHTAEGELAGILEGWDNNHRLYLVETIQQVVTLTLIGAGYIPDESLKL